MVAAAWLIAADSAACVAALLVPAIVFQTGAGIFHLSVIVLATILAQSTPQGLDVRVPALEALLGALPDRVPELAQLASPVTHVSQSAPPLLLLHGDRDPQMPVDQSYELEAAYTSRGLDVHFDVLRGAVHGGESDFFSEKRNAQAIAFLRRTLGEEMQFSKCSSVDAVVD